MQTVMEYVDHQSQGPLALVIGKHGVNADLVTNLSDHIVGAMHAIDAVIRAENGEDPRAETVAQVETAIKHFLTESYALRVEPDADADILGGYPMPYVEVRYDLVVFDDTQ